MSGESFQERTEQATRRRLEKAREEGRVVKSQELNAAAMLALGALGLYMIGPYLSHQAQGLMRYTMTNVHVIATGDPTFMSVFSEYMLKFFLITLPVFAITGVVAVASNVVQIGFKITPKSLEPKLEKLSILKGFKRLFAVKSIVQLLKDMLKLVIVGFVAYNAIKGEFATFFLLPEMPVGELAASMGKLAVILTLKVGAIMFAIAILDYLYQRYEHQKSLRMSKQELKDEYKDTEGSPQLKSRIRQIQRENSRKRMMQAVPMADVVVTNPTHLAVALKYDQGKMNAPYVLAKGQRLVAQRIKEIARENDIPVIEDRPLARALYKLCDIGDVVPEKLYRAVAELLAYVYKLKGKVIG